MIELDSDVLTMSAFGSVAGAVIDPLPDAITRYTDDLAPLLLDGLRAGGIRVPVDVALVGSDGIPSAALLNPRLTTVNTPMPEIGRPAARTIVSAIQMGTMATPQVLPVELVVRESSGGLTNA